MPRFTSDLVAEQRDPANDDPPSKPNWQRDPVNPAEALADFRRFAESHGLIMPADIETDGELHRVDVTGRNGEGDGAYLLHLDGGLPAGGVQNWQSGQGWVNWHADPGRPLTAIESDQIRRRQDADRAKRQAERERLRAEVREAAAEIWAKARIEHEHPYCAKKNIKAHGTRQRDRTNNLIVPAFGPDGVLENLQLIDPEGNKLFFKKGGIKQGCSFTIGDPVDGAVVLIDEGFATGASLHQASGYSVVVAFDSGNLLAVAKKVRDKLPNARIAICADDDWQTAGNPGVAAAKAAAAAVGGVVIVPEFSQDRGEKETDFNDVAVRWGEAEVKRQIEAALAEGVPKGGAEQDNITPPARTLADVEALIAGLAEQEQGSGGQLSTVTMAIKGIAGLRLDAITERSYLNAIKAVTKIPLDVLKKGLLSARRELGIMVTATPAATAICRQYVFVKQINAFWDRQARTVFELQAVRNMHLAEMPVNPVSEKHKKVDPLDVMLEGELGQTCDRVDIITFHPGKDEIFQEGESAALNNWTKPDLVPIKGDASPFLDHVFYILDGEKVVIDHVLDYLAHMVQKPADKIKNTILIIGAPGIGKSLIGEFVMRLLGEKNCTAIEDSDLRSAFNEWMDGVQLVLINELMSIESRETMSRLKSYITDPEIRINRKKVSTYKYKNRVNFMLFSNYDDAARVDKGDRRYLIWKSKAVKREKEYYDALWHWLDHGGAEILLHYLSTRNLEKFDPNVAPPDTQAKDEVIADSRSAIEAYLEDLFNAEDAPFRHDLVAVTDIIEHLAERKNRNVSHKQVTMFLRTTGGKALGQKRLVSGRKPHVWAIRNVAEWELATEADIRSAWRDIPAERLSDDERNRILGRT